MRVTEYPLFAGPEWVLRSAIRRTMTHPGAYLYATQEAPLGDRISTLLNDSAATPVDFRVNTILVPNSLSPEGGADVYRSLPYLDYDTVISIAPSRGEQFKRITVCSMDVYSSALGEVRIDDLVRNELCDEDDDVFLDDRGHFSGTGMDVQLPFLQRTLKDFSVVPLVMGTETVDYCKELGSAIGEIMSNRNMLVLACVDVVEASEKGMDLFRSHLMNLDITAMMVLLNQESEIKVEGKGPVLVAMIAATQRRADVVRITEMNSAINGRQGFTGALIGRY